MNNKSRSGLAMPMIIVGLMLATVTPIISRQLHLSDITKGFLMGLGIGLEIIGLIVALKHKRKASA